tara:strand:- start:1450 stop:3624 length:2175 start_codon:yes stop_codon:yes gene_type:complete
MQYRYIKNLREQTVSVFTDPLKVTINKKPTFNSKASYRDWCGETSTDHVFYTTVEGDTPALRISKDNPPHAIWGMVADYDAPVDWDNIDTLIQHECKGHMPTWRSKTFSGYLRLVWEFESKLPISKEMFDPFMNRMSLQLNMSNIVGGFDSSSLKASQVFEMGEEWEKIGDPLPESFYRAALLKAVIDAPPQVSDCSIPIDVVAKEIESKFPNRWGGEFAVGSRGPLFWVDPFIDREGCLVTEEGIVCFSDRSHKGWLTWRDILGGKFVEEYETKKLGNLLNHYWFNGKTFYKLLHGSAVSIPKDQLILELRQEGYSTKRKKGKALSEVEAAIVTISNDNRIDEIAPVVFSNDRVVSYNSHRILNTANIEPIEAADDGDPSKWPFLHKWLGQLFEDGKKPTIDYFYAWLKRFYLAVVNRKDDQGQALILVGPTNKGKSLLSNRVISALVGGFADASDYLSGQSKFNKDLARVAAWVIDDTTSAASFQDQRRATELIKRTVANPRMEYHAKYVDAVSIPWTGRVIFSLNMDANSLSVIPSLDSSNRDKLMALLISPKATSKFPPNSVVEQTIEDELPYFAKWLMDWKVPAEIEGLSRFGVTSYIDPTIASAAYDNSSRSSIAELVEFFAKKIRENTGILFWRGTLTEFQVQLHEANNGKNVGMSGNMNFVRVGMLILEEASKHSKSARPIKSVGSGGGKLWEIDLDEKYDIDKAYKIKTKQAVSV